jgi:ketosteroid isomerase-like protein
MIWRSAMRKLSLCLLMMCAATTLAVAQARTGLPKPEDELRAAEQRLADAERDGDTATLQQMLAEEFVATGATGVQTPKADFIDWYSPKHYKYMTAEELDVRVYGESAVVLGKCRQLNLDADHEEATRFTDVWVKRDGRWVVVAEHFSLLPPPQ